jgi:virginiamycin B lyase
VLSGAPIPTGSESRPRLARRASLLLGALALATLSFAARADAFIYWLDYGGTIGRANLDGTAVDQSFITGGSSGIGGGVAVNRRHIYWANSGNGTIGRAGLDGTRVDQRFITGANKPLGVALDRNNVYWANSGNGTIGRAGLKSGGVVEQDFITGTGAGTPSGVAVDAAHVYWANDDASGVGSIGRANLDGTGVDPNFIATTDGMAVTVDGGYIYWIGDPSGIGRADVHLTGVEQTFIPVVPGDHFGVAVNATHIYWSFADVGKIGIANVDGTAADENHITGLEDPGGVAIDAGVGACAGRQATVLGTGGPDTLRGTKGDDVIAAGAGDDTVVGLGGDDLVCGAAGDDRLRGKGGDDELRGGGGGDELRGGGGSNECRGGGGADRTRHC